MRLVLAAVLLTGCGRLGFDAGTLGDGSLGASDATVCTQQLCDDFEAAALAPVWNIATTGSGNVMLDTTVAHTGSSSVHFQIPALAAGVGSRAEIREAQTLALGSTTFYVRAFVRFSDLPAGTNRIEIMRASETQTAREDAVFLMPASLALYNQWIDGTRYNNSLPPANTWLCLLWRVTRATTATGSMDLGGDVATASYANIQTEGPTLDVMLFGLSLYGGNQADPQPALDIWLDDLLVDDAPLTCSD